MRNITFDAAVRRKKCAGANQHQRVPLQIVTSRTARDRGASDLDQFAEHFGFRIPILAQHSEEEDESGTALDVSSPAVVTRKSRHPEIGRQGSFFTL